MSDGPHRSLPMRRGWKKLAERADNKNYDAAEVADAIPSAVEGDWRDEVPTDFLDALRDVFGDTDQGSLFKGSVEQVERTRSLAAGKPLAQLMVDCAAQVAAAGNIRDPLNTAVANAIENHVARNFRSVEEHYLRESSANRAQRVRHRLEAACARPSYTEIARRFLQSSSSGGSPRPAKRSGLNQGVRIQR